MLLFLLCAQLLGSPVAVDSTYTTPALRDLVARASAANRTPPPEFRSYRSHIETELSLLVRDTLGREHTAQVEQLATTGLWDRGGRYDLHIIGYRSQTIGVPYSALSIVRAWTVPSLYGDRLSMGAYFNQSRRRQDTLIAVHPFATDRDSFYTFSGGDTVTVLRVGARRIPIVRIHVHPVARGATRLAAFDGEIDLDAERAQIVRMRGQFVTLGGETSRIARIARATTGAVAVAYTEFVNAEVDGKYWLPAFQRTEFQASFPAFGPARPIFRLVSNISDISVSSGAPAGANDSAYSPRVVVSWASTDSVDRYGGWERDLGTQSGSVHSDDFLDLAPDAWRPTGAPRFSLFPNTTSRILRFNRIEGLFTGLAPSVDFRNVAPGLSAGVYGGWAWSEQTVRGGAFVSHKRGTSILGARAERALASTNDFSLPFTDDPGLAALFSSVDDFDYVDRRAALMSFTRVVHSIDVGLATFQFGAGDDRGEHARLSHGLISHSAYRPNRGVSEGNYAIGSADLEMHPNITGDFVQPGLGLHAHYEAAAGELDWQRAELSLSARKYFGAISVAAHADGGIVLGNDPPPQKLFELGGTEALPGYRYKEFAGDRAALFRTFASYRFNLWRRPVRVWRNLMLPGVGPGVAVSAQGGWTELSSPGAAQAAASLATDDGAALSAPTHGVRATVGGGITLFSDLLHLGVARPIDQPAPWRFVIGYGGAF
jgi:hypothetical protein